MYDPKERGTVMGIYYAAPLLGPSIGPIIGGVLTQLFSWRATFYFLAIFGGVSLLAFIVFRDTFRRERSLSYQAALQQAGQANSSDTQNRACETVVAGKDLEKENANETRQAENPNAVRMDVAAVKIGLRHMQIVKPMVSIFRRPNNFLVLCASGIFPSPHIFLDINEWVGLIFGGISYCIPFTTVRTLGQAPYNYKSLDIGLVLLALGVGRNLVAHGAYDVPFTDRLQTGSIIGSIFGGRWSDHIRRKYQRMNGGVSKAEVSLFQLTKINNKSIHILPEASTE